MYLGSYAGFPDRTWIRPEQVEVIGRAAGRNRSRQDAIRQDLSGTSRRASDSWQIRPSFRTSNSNHLILTRADHCTLLRPIHTTTTTNRQDGYRSRYDTIFYIVRIAIRNVRRKLHLSSCTTALHLQSHAKSSRTAKLTLYQTSITLRAATARPPSRTTHMSPFLSSSIDSSPAEPTPSSIRPSSAD